MDGSFDNNSNSSNSALTLLGAHVGADANNNTENDAPFDTESDETGMNDESPESGTQSSLFDPVTSKAIAKKSKKEKQHDVLPPDPLSQATHVIENLDAAGARKMASDLIEAGEFENFRLGGVFALVNEKKYFSEYGYPDFKAWVENEYGIKYRKAMYLAGIYDYVMELKLDWNKIKHLGWTKLKTILNPNAPFVTAQSLEEWVSKAEKMTVLQLEDHIKVKGDTQAAIEGDAGKTVTTLTFKLHTDQKDTVREALERAKEQSGTPFDTVALQLIATEYLGKPHTPFPVVEGKPELMTESALKAALTSLGVMPVLEMVGVLFPDIEINVNVPDNVIGMSEEPDHL